MTIPFRRFPAMIVLLLILRSNLVVMMLGLVTGGFHMTPMGFLDYPTALGLVRLAQMRVVEHATILVVNLPAVLVTRRFPPSANLRVDRLILGRVVFLVVAMLDFVGSDIASARESMGSSMTVMDGGFGGMG